MKTESPLQKYALPLSFLLAAVALGVLYISTKAIGEYPPTNLKNPLVSIGPAIVMTAIAFALGLGRKIGWMPRKLGQIFDAGFYLWIAGCIALIVSRLLSPAGTCSRPALTAIVAFVLTNLLVSVFEEITCRGIIQNLLVARAESKGKSVWSAVATASAIFAVMHLANLIAQPTLVVATITQVFYTFAMGCVLGAAYYLSKSIWVPIIIHAGFNLLGSANDLLNPTPFGQPVQDLPIIGAVIQLVIVMPAVYFGYRLLRAPKTEAPTE